MGSIVEFPQDPILVKLLEASKSTTETIIFDASGFDKTYPQLLGDIIQTRDALCSQLPASALTDRGILREDCPYVGALTRGGYEFIVAFFAIRTLGGACIPFAPDTLPEEAHHYISTANASALLCGASNTPQAERITKYMHTKGQPQFTSLVVKTTTPPTQPPITITIDTSHPLDPRGPGIVMFTSGSTSGIPKAAVLPRQCLVTTKPPGPGPSTDATLSYRPPYWRGGFASHIGPVLAGMKVYILERTASARDVWEALRQYRITNLVFNPVLLRQMRDVWVNELVGVGDRKREEYLDGFRRLEKIRCSGAFLAPSLLEFWMELTGLKLKNAYGSTECGGGVTEVDVKRESKVKHTVGQLVTDPPIQLKLSEGTHGEFLVKSPWMLTEYMGNPEATRAAFDEDGFHKTGDIGHIEGDEYVFEGRKNDDFIGRVPRLPVEEAISNIPYIAEVHVLRIPDHETRGLVGALIRLHKDSGVSQEEMSIDRLNNDLKDVLPAWMRPYLLRVLGENEQMPYTPSQKPIKAEMMRRFFGVVDFWDEENPSPGVQVWNRKSRMLGARSRNVEGEEVRPWDWATWQISA